VVCGLIAPLDKALEHTVAPLLLQLATHGCTADCGKPWTMETLEAAIKEGDAGSSNQKAITFIDMSTGCCGTAPWGNPRKGGPGICTTGASMG
jgi:hypothetical protein